MGDNLQGQLEFLDYMGSSAIAYIHCHFRITFSFTCTLYHSPYNLIYILCQSQTIDLLDDRLIWADEE